ncbi:MAG: hypothetical protein U9Q66_04245 [Patescibacteria group bacterium]|nr:hypothetical protein [Patescibacteria group bacterium]
MIHHSSLRSKFDHSTSSNETAVVDSEVLSSKYSQITHLSSLLLLTQHIN